VSQFKEQSRIAVTLLEVLGLQYIQLELKPDGTFSYCGWTTPVVANSGVPISRREIVRLRQTR
jgi:hypothetical protein